MYPKKEHPIKIAKKVKKLEKALNKEKEKNTELRKRNKYQANRIVGLAKSRNNWKEKLKVNRTEKKSLKAKLERQGKAKGHHYDLDLVKLCIQLRINGGCSYEGISKILLILNTSFNLGLLKLPCANSIQNWVSKMGLYQLNKGFSFCAGAEKKKVSLIIDESIRLGKEKLLLILSIPTEKLKKAALKFEDVSVIYMEGATTWNGEKISEVIKELIKTRGLEVGNILSDEDAKLKKASRILDLPHVPDVSHAIATCLKRVFRHSPDYKGFTKLIASYQSKGVNQDLSYLCPPKQRAKARFMNQEKLVKWTVKMLEKMDKLSGGEFLFFEKLRSHSKLISSLAACLALAKTIGLHFKKGGLSKKSLAKVKAVIKKADKSKEYLKPFIKEMENYLDIYENVLLGMEEKVLQVSSEVIESMFGKYKSKANNYALTGLTRLNLELPLYGLSQTELSAKINNALEEYSTSNLNEWVVQYSSDSQLLRRREFFN